MQVVNYCSLKIRANCKNAKQLLRQNLETQQRSCWHHVTNPLPCQATVMKPQNQSQAAPENRGDFCDRKRGALNMVGCWSEYITCCWSTGIFEHSHLQGFQIRENIQWTAVVRRKLLYRCQMVEGEWSDCMETIRRTTGTQITTSVCRKSPLNVRHVQPCSEQRVYLLIAIY